MKKKIIEIKNLEKKLGITIVVIIHEMSVIEELYNKIAVIDKSNIVEVGDMENIFANPKSDIAKKLIFGKRAQHDDFINDSKIHAKFLKLRQITFEEVANK